MELLLIKLVALLRPLASMEQAEAVFEILGVGIFAMAVAGTLISVAVRRELFLTTIDLVILAFVAWCLAGYVIYFDPAKTSGLVKLLLPLLTYILVKNVVSEHGQYTRLLFWIIAGFAVPTFLSAALIAIRHPSAIDMVLYWTGVSRWEGVYTHSHNLGHSMTLLVMTLVLYVTLRDSDRGAHSLARKMENVALVLLGATALYCLYMSQVRSAVLGFLVFLAIYGYAQSKKLFLIGAVVFAVVAVATMPFWFGVLLHELDPGRIGGAQDLTAVGSGRLSGWSTDIAVFAGLPIDQKIAGVGIGVNETEAGELFGHNDWLRLLIDTGIVGFFLFVVVQILILKTILRLPLRERYAYLALFAAVNLMMAVSNSYTLRIQVSQIYYMVLAFVQIPVSRAAVATSPRGAVVHAR